MKRTVAIDAALHGDLAARAAVDTAAMPWSPTPSASVWRKRLHRVGPEEPGQVTSVVRYDADSAFPVHDHPDGEEILVLDGTFCDEHRDWPAGTDMLNPERFRHAPFSREGCVLFVKLRQYAGRGRRHVCIFTDQLDWLPGAHAGVSVKPLYAEEGHAETICLERWDAGAAPGRLSHPGGIEIFVLDGGLEDEAGGYAGGAWLRVPGATTRHPLSAAGCTLYVKRSALSVLRGG